MRFTNIIRRVSMAIALAIAMLTLGSCGSGDSRPEVRVVSPAQEGGEPVASVEEFCALAAPFEAQSARSTQDSVFDMSRSERDSALQQLADAAPAEVTDDLQRLVQYAMAVDLTEAEVREFGELANSVGATIESRCGIRLPYVD